MAPPRVELSLGSRPPRNPHHPYPRASRGLPNNTPPTLTARAGGVCGPAKWALRRERNWVGLLTSIRGTAAFATHGAGVTLEVARLRTGRDRDSNHNHNQLPHTCQEMEESLATYSLTHSLTYLLPPSLLPS